MPAIPIALRGLLALFTGLGLGKLFGGDTIENQTIIEQATFFEKVLWAIVTLVTLGLIVFLIIYFVRLKKRR